MAYKNLVTVNRTALPQPKPEGGYIGLTADVVDTARNVNATLVGGVVRYDVAKVEMTWNYLTAEQWSNILKLFNPTYGGSFTNPVEFYNQTTATWETRTMYVSDRTSGGVFLCDKDTGEPLGWKNPHLSLIEV